MRDAASPLVRSASAVVSATDSNSQRRQRLDLLIIKEANAVKSAIGDVDGYGDKTPSVNRVWLRTRHHREPRHRLAGVGPTGPGFRQIQRAVDQGVSTCCSGGHVHRDLGVLNPPPPCRCTGVAHRQWRCPFLRSPVSSTYAGRGRYIPTPSSDAYPYFGCCFLTLPG
jgi:hypothetical protein